MLQYSICKRNGGFVLWGDYSTLKPIHSFVMDMAEKSPTLDSEGLLPALAYDIRKAYENQREKDTIEVWDDEITIYGVEQIWPTFLLQIALLRAAMSFVDTSKNDQSLMYSLEALLEESVRKAFPKEATEILSAYQSLQGVQEQQVAELLGSRVSYFLNLGAKERRTQLHELLRSMDTMWERMYSIVGNGRMSYSFTPKELSMFSWDSLDQMTEATMKL